MSFVIFDTEYTTWEGCLTNGWTGNHKKEIVQISALKVSDNLEVLQEFNILCKPKINPVLSDYFIDLTHITNEQIQKDGTSFENAYNTFETFVSDDICYSHAWGADFFNKSDGDILAENLNLYNLTAKKNIKYRNIAEVFKRLYDENNITVKSQSSGQIVSVLGLEKDLNNLNLNPHSACYDTYSILLGLKHFYPRSLEILNFMEKTKKEQ